MDIAYAKLISKIPPRSQSTECFKTHEILVFDGYLAQIGFIFLGWLSMQVEIYRFSVGTEQNR